MVGFVSDIMKPITKLTHRVHSQFWTPTLRRRLATTDNFAKLTQLALSVLDNAPSSLCMVSGPMSTGGFGSLSKNMRVFCSSVEVAEDMILNCSVFSQMPFEDKMVTLCRQWRERNPREIYCWPILHIFYGALLASGKVKVFYFLPGWNSSRGARWEFRECAKWGIERRHFPLSWYDEACERAGVVR